MACVDRIGHIASRVPRGRITALHIQQRPIARNSIGVHGQVQTKWPKDFRTNNTKKSLKNPKTRLLEILNKKFSTRK